VWSIPVIFHTQKNSEAGTETSTRTAARMRDLALREFGGLEFHAVTEGDREVAVSCWPDEDAIRAWKRHPEHVLAQRAGRERWYESYSVRSPRSEECIGPSTDGTPGAPVASQPALSAWRTTSTRSSRCRRRAGSGSQARIGR
jgi:heme-degrading monooxygenase HmoA